MNWVETVLKKNNLWKDYCYQQTLLLWDEVCGKRIAALTRTQRFSRGTLWIEVPSPSIAHDLSLLGDKYIKRINELAGKDIVKRIRFVPGRFARTQPVSKDLGRLLPGDRAKAHTLFAQVADQGLRELFERFYLTTRKREEVQLVRGAKRCCYCGVVFSGKGKICPGCRFSGIADSGSAE